MGILKEIGECLNQCFVNDSFIGAFLDKSGIHKKSDYQKEMAEHLKKLVELKEKQLAGRGKE